MSDSLEQQVRPAVQRAAKFPEVAVPARPAHQIERGFLERPRYEHVVHGAQRMQAVGNGTSGDDGSDAKAR